MSVNSLNSLQKKKRSEQMAEYVAGRNRVNVMPRQTGANYQQPISQGQARVAEIARQNRQKATGLPVAPQTPAEIVGYQQSQRQMSTHQIGGTVLTQEQILANNINDIIGQMNRIMSQPGQMLDASYSPYYSIYMEQYRENARKAEANAYARSVAGSGGYGSSYATMAGQQAYRDTMEGFTELTPSLVMTKGEAMSDLMQQYQMAKGLRDELKAEKSEVNDVTYAAYASIAESGAFNGSNESVIRARLENMKAANPDLDVNKVMEMLQKELSASGAETSVLRLADGTEVEISNEARDAYNTALNNNLWDGTNVESLKTRLYNMGYKQTDIDVAVGMLQKEQKAQLTDALNKNLTELNDPSMIDLTEYGYTAEEVEKMDEDEYNANAKRALLDRLGESAANNVLDKKKFKDILKEDMVKTMGEIPKDDDYALRDIANLVIALDDYQTKGALSGDYKKEIMVEIAGRLPLYSAFRNLKEEEMTTVEKWVSAMSGKGEKVENIIKGLKNEEQREAIRELLKIASQASTKDVRRKG